MGNSSSDYYRTVGIEELQRKDKADFKYIWVDLKVNGAENTLYLNRFKQAFNIDPQDNINAFRKMTDAWDSKKNRLRVICAASLPDEGYQLFQNTQKIDRIILFCANKIKANKLSRDFPKIKRICFGYAQVIRVVKQWDRQELKSLIYFQDDSIQQLNIHTANWRSLVDNQFISNVQAHDNFSQYFKKMLKGAQRTNFDSIDIQYRKCINKPEHFIEFLRKQILATDKFILNEINNLLKSTSQPQKLSYLRSIIKDLYKTIRAYGSETKDKSFFFQIALNQDQKSKLVSDNPLNIFTFTHFIYGEDKSCYGSMSDYEIQVEIYIGNKNVAYNCSGYIIYGHQILMNIGNFYKIQSYNPINRKLKLSLVYLNDLNKIELTQKLQHLILNVKWSQYQQKKYEGQWNSLKQRNKYGLIDGYMSEKIKEAQSKDNNILLINKWKVKQEISKIKYNNNPEDYEALKNLEKMFTNPHFQNETIYLLEVYFKMQRFEKFMSTYQRIPKLNIQPNSLSTNLFSIYTFLYKVLKKQFHKQIIIDISHFQNQLVPNVIVQDIYHILIQVKIQCLNLLERYQEQIEVIKRLLEIYLRCFGRNSYEYERISAKLVQVISKKDYQLNEKEINQKKKLVLTKNTTLSLRQCYNDPFAVDVSSLNFNFYDNFI